MEYEELRRMLESTSPMMDWEVDSIDTMQSFFDRVFWRGTAIVDDSGDFWDSGPSWTTKIGNHGGIIMEEKEMYDILVKLTGDPKTNGDIQIGHWQPRAKTRDEYTMKVVEAYNRNIEEGERTWWTTKQYTDPSVPAPPKEWAYATLIEMTREGDPDVLRIYQTYGEPHGVWEWELQKLGNPMAINQLRFK